ncbi:PfkB family carbohydrate kinase [Nannocystis bainbridge]|uniref:PfkB family carbohydrate kinase n=1 Tax=Nannocystis bainbridge TaxID=2995303 RepID=A0ABT5E720_9BACT|nr:PfkB family carbohydrate kinase [Nannocystis bainbridge]MDC0721654.1 PfkB family carbohydrate kinase [Nannocystis bainbridge]
MRVAVIGHVEWIEFVRVARVPAAGDIVHARDTWEGPGGGGAVAAAQLARLADDCIFFTALGDDDLGARARRELSALGLRLEAATRPGRQRRGLTFVDDTGERTITVIGERLAPHAADPLAWDLLTDCDAVYVTAGDPDALRLARRARKLVTTARISALLRAAGIEVDALVGSAHDPAERYAPGDLHPPPRLVVRTAGAAGGTYEALGHAPRPYPAAPLPGPVADAYGCGDSFAAGLTYALGAGLDPDDAVRLAARCGAAALTGRGPHGGQLDRSTL